MLCCYREVTTEMVCHRVDIDEVTGKRVNIAFFPFKMADQVLYMGVRGVTDLMMVHGQINLDFADIKTVMAEMGKAMMGTGEAEGEDRAKRAAEASLNPRAAPARTRDRRPAGGRRSNTG
jgi:hypothetical protein